MALSSPPTARSPDDILTVIASNPPSHAVTIAAIAGAAAVVASGAVALPRLLPKPGPARLVAIAPLLAILAALPLAPPPSVVLRGTVAFVCWLAAMKLLAFACGRGALALPGLSNVQRALLLLLPITPLRPQQHQHQKHATEPTTAWRSSALAALNAAALAAFIVVLREDGRGGGPWSPMPPLVRHAMYAAVVYLAVALVLDSFAPLALASAFGGGGGAAASSSSSSSRGPALAPSMRAPWGARSLSSFWSYHYNTAVSGALRHCAYAPVAQGSLFKRGGASGGGGDNNNKQQQQQHPHHVSPARRAAGLTLVFFVSGLAHEVIVNGFMCGAAQEQRRLTAAAAARRGAGAATDGGFLGPRPGLMMGFFLAQVPALLLEQRVHDMWRERRRRRSRHHREEADGGRANGNGAAAAATAKTSGWAGAAFSLASHALRAALTLLALLLMTDVGFFPAMEACAVDRAGIEEVGAAVDRLRAAAAARGWWGWG
jgi:hypothetical protein